MLFKFFFDGDRLKEVNDPREFRYMRILRLTMKFMGAWPGKDLRESNCTKYEVAPAYFLICIKTITTCLSLLFFKIHHSSLPFLQVGHNYITLFMAFVTLVRLTTLPLTEKYRDVVKRFVSKIHLYYFRNDSVYAMETHVKVHKTSYFFTIYLHFLLFFGLFLFNSSPLYKNYKNGKLNFNIHNNISFEFAIYYVLPFNTTTNLKGYIIVAIFNWFAAYICSSVFCIFDLLLYVMIFHIYGHFKILIYNLKSFPKPATSSNTGMQDNVLNYAQFYSHQEMIEIENKLVQCINYHRLLINFKNDFSSVFGPMLFFYCVFHQVSGCVLLLEISQLNPAAIIKYGPLTVVLFQQLVQLSYIIESIGTVTGQLKDAVYGMPWEHMNTKNRKTLLIFLMNVQAPIHFNGLGLARIGVTSMAAIIKTSLSYFAFLRSVAE